MLRPRLRFGVFMAPFHPVTENPTLCLERDRELIEWLDELGFDEAWIGEHHSAGYEITPAPSCSSPTSRRAPSTSGWAPASSPCPITRR